MIIVSNFTKLGRVASVSNYGGDYVFNGNAGDIIEVQYRVSAISGAPSAATFAARWQLAPKTLATLDEDSVSSQTARKWFDVAKTDAKWTDYFVDEDGNPCADWPTTIADLAELTDSAGKGVFIARKIKLPANFLARAPITSTFTGGTSPFWTYTQAQTQYSKLA